MEKKSTLFIWSQGTSGIVSDVAAGCLCFPSEVKQMSVETPALAQPPPPLPASPDVRGRRPALKYTQRSAPWHAIILSTGTHL